MKSIQSFVRGSNKVAASVSAHLFHVVSMASHDIDKI